MSNNKINILKGLDNDLTIKILKALQFLCKANKLSYNVNIIDDFNFTLGENDFLILYLDELSLNEINNSNVASKFFVEEKYEKKQILLITDDLYYEQLPEYMHYFAHFYSDFPEDDSINEDDYEFGINKNQSELIQVLFDMVRYIKSCLNNKNKKNKTVFMGPPDGKTTIESYKIIRELLQRDYIIKPEIINPSAKELINNKELLFKILDESDLAIHFISHESLEKYPIEVSPSYAINKLVSDYCNQEANKNLNRIIYVPAEKVETSDEAIRKIAQFKSDVYNLSKAELVQTPIEKLKSIILSKIDGNELDSSNEVAVDNEDYYFIFPPGQETKLESVFNLLENKNISFSKSQVELDQIDLLQYHRNKISTCKSVIIYNFGNEEWVQRKISDIQKSPGWGRIDELKYKIIFGDKLSDDFCKKNIDDSFIILDSLTESNINQIIEG